VGHSAKRPPDPVKARRGPRETGRPLELRLLRAAGSHIAELSSNRSRFMTFVHAATKSSTNLRSASALA